MKLSNRLERILSFVEEGDAVADVGCDHGFAAIELVSRGIASKVSALDVNRDPLEKARENAARAGVMEKIGFYLSDGLEKLPEGEADTVIIAGMGGMLMSRIISDTPKAVMKGIRKLILSPQSEQSHFRHFLADNGFEIEDEALIYEDNKFYPVILAKNTGIAYSYEKEIYYRYGKILPERADAVLRENLLYDISILEKILKNPSLPEDRRKELESEKKEAEAILY